VALIVLGRLATWSAKARVALRTLAQWPALSAEETLSSWLCSALA
jgi:hypothetical protein